MISLLIILLTACVLALSGTVVILAGRLHTVNKNRAAVETYSIPAENPELAALRQRREQAAQLCMDVKRRLTHICTTAPSAIPGLSIERVRLLCADSLKDQVNAVFSAFQNGFPDRLAWVMDARDFAQLDMRINRLSLITEEVKKIDEALTPIFKAWSPNAALTFDSYEQRLIAVSQQLDELHREVQALLCALAEKRGTGEAARSVPERVRQASLGVADANVRAALAGMEALIQQYDDALDRQTKERMESYYLPTLELILGELSRAERAGEDTQTRVQLSLRVIRVLSHIVAAGQRNQREITQRSLEAEVIALERLAALRGDTAQ